jgi:hypothetical protein
LASTREQAVVGVAGGIPSQLIRLIPDFLVAPNEALRGVGVTPLNVSALGVIIVNVSVDGVHAVWLRSGGNTNSVCCGAELDGTIATWGAGGVTGNLSGAGRVRAVLGVARVGTATGEDGTVGRGVGRLYDLIEGARDPGAGNVNPDLPAGADGGAPRGLGRRSNGGGGMAPNDERIAV